MKNIPLKQSPKNKKPMHPSWSFFLEITPLILFFFITLTGDQLADFFSFLDFFGKPLFMATALFIIATFFSTLIFWISDHKIPIITLLSTVMVILFGSLSIWLQDDTFIKTKPTILYTLLGTLLMIGAIFKKPLPKYLFGTTLSLDKQGWRKLSLRWSIACFSCAILNEIVWRSLEKMFSVDLADKYWVTFKLFGLTAITFIFVLLQMPMIRKHLERKNLP